MKYKFSRKEIHQWLREQNWYCSYLEEILLALADEPCKHEYDLECDNKALVCRKCGKFRPTPLKTEPKEECKHSPKIKTNGIYSWVECIKCGKKDEDIVSKSFPLQTIPTVPSKIDLSYENDRGQDKYATLNDELVESKINEILDYLISLEEEK
jgi:hypothetical protein